MFFYIYERMFSKNIQQLKAIIFFLNTPLQSSEYASVICWSFLGKIEDTDKFDSVAIWIYSF